MVNRSKTLPRLTVQEAAGALERATTTAVIASMNTSRSGADGLTKRRSLVSQF
jgi:hypothetical protein